MQQVDLTQDPQEHTSTLLDGSTQDYFTTTAKNGLCSPDYHRLDVSANYNIYSSKERNEIGYIGFSIFNYIIEKTVGIISIKLLMEE